MLHSISIISYVVLTSFVSSNDQHTSIRERIPNYLQEICPGSGVCLNDIIDPDNNLPSCCGACSCSADCEMNGNCCFPNKDNDTVDDIRLSSRYHSECIYPIANQQYEAFAYHVYQPYNMISSTAKDIISYGTDNINVTTCGEVKVAPWGSMYPVYSKTSGKIYKNSVYADEHNIADGELWRAYVSCNTMPDATFSSRLQNGSIPDHCYVLFVYKGRSSSIKSEICYHGEHYEARCIDTFDVPESLSLSREELVAFCESGLISPYNGNYANIFCFICRNSAAFGVKDIEECIEKSNDEFGIKRVEVAITMLFDGNDFGGTFNGNAQTDYVGKVRIACLTTSVKQTERGCRAISCPLGQLLSQEECVFPGNKWYTAGYYIVINLSSERSVNISALYNSIQNLKSPWPNSWIIRNISYKVTAVLMQTRDIVVNQYMQFHSPFSPKSFISRVHKYIAKPWLLKTYNETVKLQAQLSGSKTTKMQVYNSIYFNRNNALKMTSQATITKLHLCDNVILLPSEYSIDIGPGYKTLLNSITNKTLSEWEYAIDDNGNGVVCLEDSGFYRVASNNSIKLSPHIIIVQCLAIIYMTLIL